MIERIRFKVEDGAAIEPPCKQMVLDVEIERDIDGWWAYLPEGWYFTDDPCCTQRHEDTKAELMLMLRGGYEIGRE